MPSPIKAKASPSIPEDDLASVYDRFREAGLGRKMAVDVEAYAKGRRRKRRRTAALASATALALAGLLWLVPYVRNTSHVATRSGSRRTLVLEDGSRLELNANTRISTDFRSGRRSVNLTQGEAFFSVARDPAHPFFVITPLGTIHVTGTQFNVRLGEGTAEEVTLVEGRVQIEGTVPASPPTALAPGEEARISNHDAVIQPLTPAALDRLLAWRRGKIVLTGMTLQEAAERFAEYHGVSIQVDPDVASLQLGGTDSLEDLSHFLNALQETKAATVIHSLAGSYRLGKNTK